MLEGVFLLWRTENLFFFPDNKRFLLHPDFYKMLKIKFNLFDFLSQYIFVLPSIFFPRCFQKWLIPSFYFKVSND